MSAPGFYYSIGSVPDPGIAAGYDVVVLDPDEAPGWLVKCLHGRGVAVLAYVNVGYAEEWRGYWRHLLEAGVVHEASGYEGEYLVELWSPVWRSTITSEAEAAAARGFDGVFLDNLDAVYEVEARPWARGVNVTGAMLGLVAEVSSRTPLVYVNVGSAVELAPVLPGLGVEGVLREELLRRYTGGGGLEWVEPLERVEAVRLLQEARGQGADVVVVEPVSSVLEAAALEAYLSLLGFTPVPQPVMGMDYSSPPLLPLRLLPWASRATSQQCPTLPGPRG